MSCEAANPDVIDLGTRLAIYSYAACSATLGFLTLLGNGQRQYIQEEEEAQAYTEKVVKHIKDVNFAVATSTLTGIALIIAALFHQHYFHTFTLFHAYIVLLLLWVITLTGMWFAIHAWVFDILTKNKRRMNTLDFWKRILYQSKWFTIQFSLMGGYGLYVTIRRGDFQLPECVPWVFKHQVLSAFVYGFAAFPILNSCMLFIITSLLVWTASVVVALCSRRGWRGQVDPVIFCFFWLLEYVLIIGGLVLAIELQLRENTAKESSPSPFGSTLAIALVIVPLQLVAERVWQMISHDHEPPRRQSQHSRGGMSESQPFIHSRESTGGTTTTRYTHAQRASSASYNSYGSRPPPYHR
ncbi:unnamed protein product [Rhizoctonia solani]|uniref:Transmembrane protein n=1 Tax=Rhizoctonia solani TaxID=456999 RepID=A0A8H3AN02_9AGAM|nr:unnamed protein product [Rhizoctonia solani]